MRTTSLLSLALAAPLVVQAAPAPLLGALLGGVTSLVGDVASKVSSAVAPSSTSTLALAQEAVGGILALSSNKAAVSPISEAEKSLIATNAYLAQVAVCAKTNDIETLDDPDYTLVGAGGDGNNFIPRWFVAYSASRDSLVLSRRGTNTSSLPSSTSNLGAVLLPLNQTRFPGTLLKGVLAHTTYSLTQGYSADELLAVVRKGVVTHNTTKIQVLGHSLGSAISVLDALYLALQEPTWTVSSRLFGAPRVGNAAYSLLFDSLIKDSHYITNHGDIIPLVLFPVPLGFLHTANEIYITPEGEYNLCPGYENLNCAAGQDLTKQASVNHLGPYNGVMIGDDYC